MNGNGYGYYHPSHPHSYPMDLNQSWGDWTYEQQQYNNNLRGTMQHHNNPISNANTHTGPYAQNRSQNFYNVNNRQFQQRRYNNPNPPFPGGQQNWQRGSYKRPRPQDSPGDSTGESKNKNSKKKKKPLSQNVPSKKDWTLEEAKQALAVEKEYNKRCKDHSLIIKFPDQELNRDIVLQFHPSIENVHFQQPSTPRFCFVTLQESADSDAVINELNKIPFGEGHLTAEYKKDREEEQNIGPEDIDPSTLYVGNLAQDITKEKMVETYPKNRRIDIGYAKKMKYTRYAFVSFHNVSDSIEAFRQTHNKQLLSKSLIVRFRRLHGTVGMPGESKIQSPAKRPESTTSQEQTAEDPVAQSSASAEQQSCVASDTQSVQSDLDLSVVKQEITSSDEETNDDLKLVKDYESPFMAGSLSTAFLQHRPKIKREIKQEAEDNASCCEESRTATPSSTTSTPQIKTEPAAEPPPVVVKTERPDEDETSSDDDSDGEDVGLIDVNFTNILRQLDRHSSQIETLKKWNP